MTFLDLDPCAALAHEQVIPSRVQRIVDSWAATGVQQTPVLVFEENGSMLIADGHHRIAAGRQIRAVRIRAIVIQQPVLKSAHRTIQAAPPGWIEAVQDRLRTLPLTFNCNGLGLCRNGQTEFYDCAGMSASAQMRLLWDAADFTDPALAWTVTGVVDPEAAATILVPRFSVQEVVAAALGNLGLLPPRSTNFQPKPVEGSIQFPLTCL